PLEYMRKYAAFEVEANVYLRHESELSPDKLEGAKIDERTGIISSSSGAVIGVMIDDRPVVGFNTPSRRLEFYSRTMKEWHWPEYALPGYIRSHIHWQNIDSSKGEMALVPTFRLPTLIHTRSGNAKWLNEISHSNPVWIHTEDARRLGV